MRKKLLSATGTEFFEVNDTFIVFTKRDGNAPLLVIPALSSELLSSRGNKPFYTIFEIE